MSVAGVPKKAGRGRPRRHDDAAEVRLIVDAATGVMREKGYSSATVQDILEKADLGTRAFYRHFKSKDDLLHAIYRSDAEKIGERIRRRLQPTETPREAVEAWIDEVLSLAYNPRRAERMALIESEVRGNADGYEQERVSAVEMVVAPLVTALRAGRRDGSFPDTKPTRDAYLVNAMVFEVIKDQGHWKRGGKRQATADLLRFCLPAIGWKGPA
jgi:AcrR family transcriptional regulator